MIFNRLIYSVTLAGSVSILSINAAMAQDVAFDLGTLVLYGDRTTGQAEKTNSSVAIVTAAELADPTISNYRDAFRHMANVQAGDFVESGFVLRGINSEGQTPGGLGTPLAAYYIDGVQQTVEGTRRGINGVFDAEQIEVFRGPQSTLSGRSALAGAIHLRTKDPEFARSGKVELGYGSDNKKSVGLAFGDTLAPNLAYRISGEYYSKDNDLNYPSYTRFDRYDDITSDEQYTLRGKLLWQATDQTDVLFSYSHSYGNPAPNDIAGPYWSTASTGYGAQRGDIWGNILPDFYTALIPEFPGFQDVRNTKVDNFGIEVTHHVNDNLTFTAQTGYSSSLTERYSINEGTAGEFLTVAGEFDQELLTQEFRLNYEAEGLRWVGGFYIGKEEQTSFRDATLPSFTTYLPENQYSENTGDMLNIAAFGEVAYEFAPSWTVIAGGRLDYFDQDQTASLVTDGVPTSNSESSFSDTVFVPKVGIEYELANSNKIALIYQEGYRPGGSGILAATGAAFEYDAEKAKNLELSYRGRGLDDKLGFAASVFYQDWDSQQVEVGSYPNNYITNAGKSKSYGAELELSYAATDIVDLYGSVGLLHTEFKSFEANGIDYSGQSFPGAPEASISLGYYAGEATGWFSTGSIQYTGSSLSRLEGGVAQPVKLDNYTTVDLSVGYAWEKSKLTAYVTNAFDTDYFTYENGPGVLATQGEGREIGLVYGFTF
ncbi:TonB-dependent receptor [Pseudorhodobacter turbinis]|uniref:TonB-dependent receptor n=1 Tax=Pseudorhodobacter turbinis TaxID=2500533 RepID=A0A4P8EFU8_9RHOB|nr:TonB-dependent receptor [Pseudorhodobacter turbinis]QCO55756.1 TonB-dependent receptor [Pseudorhodobacter turbinis]